MVARIRAVSRNSSRGVLRPSGPSRLALKSLAAVLETDCAVTRYHALLLQAAMCHPSANEMIPGIEDDRRRA